MRFSDVPLSRLRKALLREDLNVKVPVQAEEYVHCFKFMKRPAGKNRVMNSLVDTAVLGVNVSVTVAAFAKMRSELAMVIENCVARVPDS